MSLAILNGDDSTLTLEVKLAGAASANQPEFVCNYADHTTTALTPDSTAGVFNDTTEVVAAATPGASTQRVVESLHVYNKDTAAVTVEVIFADSDGTDRVIRRQEIDAGKSYCFSSSFADDVESLVVGDLPDLGGFTDKTNIGSDDRIPIYDTENSANKDVAAFFLPSVCEGRLTPSSGTPITTSNVIGAGTIYFTPYKGDRIALYDGTRWKLYTFTERSLALTVTDATNYDVFIYDNSGTLTLELTAWSDGTTRATALTTVNGIYCKSGVTTRRYLGTIRATGTNTIEDSSNRRFVWNYYNRVNRRLYAIETTNSWTYSTATWRAANNTTTAGTTRVEFVTGYAEDSITGEIYVCEVSTTTSGVWVSTAIALDSTSTYHSQVYGGILLLNDATEYTTLYSKYRGNPVLGYHYLQWVEKGGGGGTQTWYGDGGDATVAQSGMTAEVMG